VQPVSLRAEFVFLSNGMRHYSEVELLKAVAEVRLGRAVKTVARQYSIPRTTIQSRIKGVESHATAAAHLQRLSKVQEQHLVDWITTQDALGLPPTHSQIRELATRVLRVGGDHHPLGIHWMEGFFKRNPSVRTTRGRRMEAVRLNGATTSNIRQFFSRLDHPAIQDIPPENRHNMDESGLMEGKGINGLVVGSTDKSFSIQKDNGLREWITFIESISATGRSTNPLVIFKGASVQQQWFCDNLDELQRMYGSWRFYASPNGWTSNDIAVAWLREVFIPETTPATPGRRLLILDGHGSHETDDFIYECYSNNIQLLFLPAHASHVLQPLDLSVFGSLKSHYRREFTRLGLDWDITVLGKREFMACYSVAREYALTPNIIKSGWRATGLWPVAISKPLMSPLLLENKTRPPETPKNPVKVAQMAHAALIPKYTFQLPTEINKTPEKSKDMVMQRSALKSLDLKGVRLLLRKAGKSLDNKNQLLSVQAIDIKRLNHRIQQLTPKPRRKVAHDPNSKFTTIGSVVASKRALENSFNLQDHSHKVAFDQLCSEWQIIVPNVGGDLLQGGSDLVQEGAEMGGCRNGGVPRWGVVDLTRFPNAQAREERDKVYALLGMSADVEDAARHGLVADYTKPIQQVIHDTFAHLFDYDLSSFTRLRMPDMTEFLQRLHLFEHLIMMQVASRTTTTTRLKARLKRQRGRTDISSKLLEAAVRNPYCSAAMVALLLPQVQKGPDSTNIFLQYYAKNPSKQLVELLHKHPLQFDNVRLHLLAGVQDSPLGEALLRHVAERVEQSAEKVSHMIAAKRNHRSLIQLLLENGADVDATD
jgi:hypothetical protein